MDTLSDCLDVVQYLAEDLGWVPANSAGWAAYRLTLVHQSGGVLYVEGDWGRSDTVVYITPSRGGDKGKLWIEDMKWVDLCNPDSVEKLEGWLKLYRVPHEPVRETRVAH